jgi:hypothetical protein
LLWLREHSPLRRLLGHDNKEGWLTNSKGKALLYDTLADMFRQQQTLLHSFTTFAQLANLDGSTLKAPPGEDDDRADAYALASVAFSKVPPPISRPHVLSSPPRCANPFEPW